jgi:hypothetical protein
MKAILKGVSNDLFDLSGWAPDGVDFMIDLRVSVGAAGISGADDFELNVCTPGWLRDNSFAPRWGRGLLIVNDFNYSVIKDIIARYIDGCDGDSWDEIVAKLCVVMKWEFDDYSIAQ